MDHLLERLLASNVLLSSTRNGSFALEYIHQHRLAAKSGVKSSRSLPSAFSGTFGDSSTSNKLRLCMNG